MIFTHCVMYELLNQRQDLVFFHSERSVKLKCENMDACTTVNTASSRQRFELRHFVRSNFQRALREANGAHAHT